MDDKVVMERLKPRVSALVAASKGYKDMADFFFDFHPTPEALQAVDDIAAHNELVLEVCALVKALRVLFARAKPLRFADRTFALLWKDLVADPAEESPGVLYRVVVMSLAAIAKVYQPVLEGEPVVTNKDKLLQYFLWIVRGRKDEDSPLGQASARDQTKAAGEPPLGRKRNILLPSSELTPYGTDCVRCGKADSRLYCPHCVLVEEVEGEDDDRVLFGAFYCGSACCSDDKANHQNVCDEVRALFRAEKIFKGAFGRFLRLCNDSVPEEITTDGPLVTSRHDSLHRRAYLGAALLKPFPRNLAPETESLVVMSHSYGCDAFTTGSMLFEFIMRPVAALVEEILIQPKNMRRTVLRLQGEERSFSALCLHHPLRLTLPCGLQFAFDPTGMQFGWKETLVPWDLYLEKRVHNGIRHIIVKQPLNSSVAEACTEARLRPDIPWQTPFEPARVYSRRLMLEYVAINFVSMSAGTWGTSSDNIMSVLLARSSDFEFEAFWDEMQRQLQVVIRSAVHGASMNQRLFFDDDMQVHITRAQTECMKLEKVWLTEEEYQSLKTARRAQRTYAQRFRKKCKGPKGL